MQRSGIGSVLLGEIKLQIKSKDMNAIILTTQKAYPAYNFYLKNGFKEFDGMAFLAASV